MAEHDKEQCGKRLTDQESDKVVGGLVRPKPGAPPHVVNPNRSMGDAGERGNVKYVCPNCKKLIGLGAIGASTCPYCEAKL